MKRFSVLVIMIMAVLSFPLLGNGCESKENNANQNSLTSSNSSKSTSLEQEYRYYAGTIGSSKARLVYWPNGSQGTAPNQEFFDGMYVLEGQNTEPERLTISFTSGGHFVASGYKIIQGKNQPTKVQFESTEECDGANEEGKLCGEVKMASGKTMQFNFLKTEKFVIEDYLKKK